MNQKFERQLEEDNQTASLAKEEYLTKKHDQQELIDEINFQKQSKSRMSRVTKR